VWLLVASVYVFVFIPLHDFHFRKVYMWLHTYKVYVILEEVDLNGKEKAN